jgi:hypothetical protein
MPNTDDHDSYAEFPPEPIRRGRGLHTAPAKLSPSEIRERLDKLEDEADARAGLPAKAPRQSGKKPRP